MNNKGFTLIELIATIALLAVIALISFVSISSVIKKNKINNCNTLVDNIKGAANEYVSDHRYDEEFVDNDVTIDEEDNRMKVSVNANTLIVENYLSGNITDPFTGEKINGSRIGVDIVLNDDYTMDYATVWLLDEDENKEFNCNN